MPKSRLPKRIKICAHTYKVQCNSSLGEPSKASVQKFGALGKHAFHYGEVELSKCLIKLNKKMCQSMMAETLLHEVFHAMIDEIPLRAQIPTKVEEQVVQGLSQMLLQILRDNPTLVSYLVAKE